LGEFLIFRAHLNSETLVAPPAEEPNLDRMTFFT
jgi:hypothetical protein